jgi:hypothetical protein
MFTAEKGGPWRATRFKNGKQGPPISHLLFANDSIFFCRSDDRSVSTLKGVLRKYCDASGQRINLQKSSIFFGNKCLMPVKNAVKSALEVHNEVLQDSYLGMPTEIARAASSSFTFLVDRVWRSVSIGADRPMSRAGKAVKLKTVTQAIPNYVMSCFRVPVGICNKLKSSVANDWWGIEEGKRKLHWRSWDWLSTPKTLGGLGFRDFVLFNQAMLFLKPRHAWQAVLAFVD